MQWPQACRVKQESGGSGDVFSLQLSDCTIYNVYGLQPNTDGGHPSSDGLQLQEVLVVAVFSGTKLYGARHEGSFSCDGGCFGHENNPVKSMAKQDWQATDSLARRLFGEKGVFWQQLKLQNLSLELACTL